MSIQSQSTPAPAARKLSAKESFLARLLDPVDRLVEGIYGVLIVMTFTLASRAASVNTLGDDSAVTAYLSDLFWAALGCAVAWGLIDGVMYVLTAIFDRGKERRLFITLSKVTSPAEGAQVLANQVDDDLALYVTPAEREKIYTAVYERLKGQAPPRVGIERADWAGAFGIFLVAVGAALPLLVPLLLFPHNPALAVRLSNFVAFVMLFGMGYRWAQYAGGKPLLMGSVLLLIGIIMVGIAIPLGG